MSLKNTRSNSLPAEWLVENVPLLPHNGRALDIAMGNGRNAVYLAGLGLSVEGVDISAGMIAEAQKLAAEAGVDIQASAADLENGYCFKAKGYEVIICFNYLYRPLMVSIKEALKPGGIIVYETYITDQARWGKPKNPEHLLRHNELLDTFRDFRVLRYREGIMEDRKAVAGLVAQKPPAGVDTLPR